MYLKEVDFGEIDFMCDFWFYVVVCYCLLLFDVVRFDVEIVQVKGDDVIDFMNDCFLMLFRCCMFLDYWVNVNVFMGWVDIVFSVGKFLGKLFVLLNLNYV